MKIPEKILMLLARNAGADISTAAGCDVLCNDIVSVTGERISLNTIKRLTGVIKEEGSHRKSTLDIIARYLGFPDWDTLSTDDEYIASVFNPVNAPLFVEHLSEGTNIELRWEPNRSILLKVQSDGYMLVIKSKQSKLMVGDLVKASSIVAGFPFYASSVIREGRELGTYTAAEVTGIKSVKTYLNAD